mgnify:FL=1
MLTDDPTQRTALDLFDELGWRTADCRNEECGPGGTLGRETRADVVLVERLLPVLRALNPGVTEDDLGLAVERLTRDRSTLDPVSANRDVYQLLRDGCRVAAPGPDGTGVAQTVRFVDWDDSEANDFLAVRGFCVTGETSTRCLDLVGFVNGIPVVVGEIKSVHRDLEGAFGSTLVEYERMFPQLYWYNAFSIISNGDEGRLGPMATAWERWGTWKRVAAEEEAPQASLERLIRGTCDKTRLLDLMESAFLFVTGPGGPTKMMAKNHQQLAVHSAVEALRDRAGEDGRLGVFWHARGSGKGVCLALLAQKVLRKVGESWTFVVVTDRAEVEEQAYGRLAAAGLVKKRVHADTAEALKRSLTGKGHFVFTPIRQFRGSPDGRYPEVSARSDVLVIALEAHRPQYGSMTLNIKKAFPNASFTGFTSTPLLAGEEGFRQVFGDYLSIYNYRDSVQDGVTVPLYYERRVPQAEVFKDRPDRVLEAFLQDAELDRGRETRLEDEFGRRYFAITDDERLDTVAHDIVRHFTSRAYLGKAVVVSIDRITAVRMYDKVRAYWALQLAGMRLELGSFADESWDEEQDKDAQAGAQVAYWENTDMAVVLPGSAGDIEEFYKRGVDLAPHLDRQAGEDLLGKFNDPLDPLRLVFTSAEWVTGLDLPVCSTVYLDKPLRDHSLVQTVSRANGVLQQKTSGLVVDYLGVFADPRRALAAYGAASRAGVAPGDLPVMAKSRLVKELRTSLSALAESLRGAGFEPDIIRQPAQSPKLRLVDGAIDAVLASQATKEEYLARARRVLLLYRAIMPDPAAEELGAECALHACMLKRIRALTSEPGLSLLEKRLVRLLEASVVAQGFGPDVAAPAMPEVGRSTGVRKLSTDDAGIFGPGTVDLTRLDMEDVWRRFGHSHKNIEIERLRGLLDERIENLVALNPCRLELRERLASVMREGEAQDLGADALLERLLALVKEVNEEGGRAAREGVKEEELALFDLLVAACGSEVEQGERERVKSLVRESIAALKADRLVPGWRKDRAARREVRGVIEEVLDRLPDPLAPAHAARAADALFQHIYDSYPGGGRGTYAKG